MSEAPDDPAPASVVSGAPDMSDASDGSGAGTARDPTARDPTAREPTARDLPTDPRAREQVRRRFERLQTAIVCDVYDDQDLEPTALATDLSRRSGEGTFAGWAYPLAGQFPPVRGADRRKLEAVDAMEPGQVASWCGCRRTR